MQSVKKAVPVTCGQVLEEAPIRSRMKTIAGGVEETLSTSTSVRVSNHKPLRFDFAHAHAGTRAT